jgi:hypothetical protein
MPCLEVAIKSFVFRSVKRASNLKRTSFRGGRRRLAAERLEDRNLLAAYAFGEVQQIGNGALDTSANGSLAMDADGNSYVAGYFEGAVDFDPAHVHPGDVDWLTSVGNDRDLFVAKYSLQGALLWVRAIESDVTVSGRLETVNEIAVDDQGNLYVAGDFADTLRVGSITIASVGDHDGFLFKFSEEGDALWATRWGTSLRDTGSSVTVGPNGEVYVAGVRDDDTTAPEGDTLVRRFDPLNGEVLWSRSVASGSYPARIGADSDGNVNLASTFFNPFDADPGAAVHMLTHGEAARAVSSTYALQFAANGDLNWARAFELQTPVNTNEHSFANSQRLAVDQENNLFVVGQHYGVVDYDPSSSGSAQLAFSMGSYVVKLSQQGDFHWVTGAAGDAVYTNRSIKVDVAGNVFVVGYLSDFDGSAIDFDPGHEFTGFIPTNQSFSYFDSYIWSVSEGGEFRSLDHLGNAGSLVQALGLGIDPANRLHVVGSFVGSIDFNPAAGIHTLSTAARSAFSLRLDATPGITVNRRQGHVTSESGQSTSIEISLDSPPTADVFVPISSSDPSEGLVNVSSLLFTPSNWQVPQSVMVTGANDATVDGDIAYSILLGAAVSVDLAYHGLNADDVSVTNLDDDVLATKFYVVNDATINRTYEYAADGASIENYALAGGNTTPRGAASIAAGTTLWVGDKNRKVYVYDADGGLQGSWTAGTLTATAQVEGLATNGVDIWIVDSKSDKVYRYANAAARRSGSQTAASNFSLNNANKNPKGIVTDGVFLWVVDDSTTNKVFKYALNGALVGSWTIDSANKTPTGLTIDPSGATQDVWIVDSGTDRVYQYANGRAKTSGSLPAVATFQLSAGNTNPQGIADPPAPMTPHPVASTDRPRAAAAPAKLGHSSEVDAALPTLPMGRQKLSRGFAASDVRHIDKRIERLATTAGLVSTTANSPISVSRRLAPSRADEQSDVITSSGNDLDEAIELIANDFAVWHFHKFATSTPYE